MFIKEKKVVRKFLNVTPDCGPDSGKQGLKVVRDKWFWAGAMAGDALVFLLVWWWVLCDGLCPWRFVLSDLLSMVNMFCLIIFTLAFIPSLFSLLHFPHPCTGTHLLALYHSDSMSKERKLSEQTLPCPALSSALHQQPEPRECHRKGKTNWVGLFLFTLYTLYASLRFVCFFLIVFDPGASFFSWIDLKETCFYISSRTLCKTWRWGLQLILTKIRMKNNHDGIM